jgi:uncharacterized protein YwgA
MNRYLYNLAIEILLLYPGQSKVKFAKLIYFLHKEIVRFGLVKTEELSFVRMPLGPVPVGFMTLQHQVGIEVSELPTPLLYNSQVYNYFGPVSSELSDSIITLAKTTFKPLMLMSTSSIVELSHQDDSWKKLNNGDEFKISEEDLKTEIPKDIKSGKENNSSLQEMLVSGMLSDIVASSTSLEYPEDER